MWFSFFNLWMWCVTLIDCDIEQSLHPVIKPIWSQCMSIGWIQNSVFFWVLLNYVYQWSWPELCVCVGVISLSTFGIRVMLSSSNEFQSIPNLSFYSSSLLLRYLNVFVLMTLNSLSGRLLIFTYFFWCFILFLCLKYIPHLA